MGAGCVPVLVTAHAAAASWSASLPEGVKATATSQEEGSGMSGEEAGWWQQQQRPLSPRPQILSPPSPPPPRFQFLKKLSYIGGEGGGRGGWVDREMDNGGYRIHAAANTPDSRSYGGIRETEAILVLFYCALPVTVYEDDMLYSFSDYFNILWKLPIREEVCF